LVVANAAAPEGAGSAFTRDEIAAVQSWVRAGGSLLLIVDHAPFPGAAASLGRALGVFFRNSFASYTGPREQDLFRSGRGLANHAITRGVCGDPAVTVVRSRTSAAGLLQGATRTFGRGRLVVMAEAAMFSSQLEGPEKAVMGFGARGAEQNQQFTLNLMHWLSGRPGC
jgi:hypothetical protein